MTSKYDFKVSAVIPAYNAEKYIRETIGSLISQTHQLSEIIVVDDNSGDNTCAIVKELMKSSGIPVKLIRNENNQGVSASRNKGMLNAKGDWILFMDADDVAEKSLLKFEYGRLKELDYKSSSDWILVYPAYRQIDEKGELLSEVMRGKHVEADEIFGYEIVRNQIITPSGLLINKDVVMKNGGFKIGLQYQIEDWELWLRLAKIGGFAYADEPLVKVRRHFSNATKNLHKVMLAELEVLKNYDIDTIKAGIFRRKLSKVKNLTDYVSVLYKLDYWDIGYEELNRINAHDLNDSVMFLKGLYYIKRSMLESAKNSFESAVELNRKNGAAMNNLGVLHALCYDIVDARSNFIRVLELYPGYIDANNNLKCLESAEGLTQDNCRYTWRELRPVLLRYSE